MKMKLSHKLTGGYILSALIALLVGGVSLYYVNKLSSSLQDMGKTSLPSVESLAKVDAGLQAVETAQRTRLSPFLSIDNRKQVATDIVNARAYYNSGKNNFIELLKQINNKDLNKDWEAFQTNLTAALKYAADYDKKFEALNKTGIHNPDYIRSKIEQFIGDHYKAEVAIANTIRNGKMFKGGDDPAACNFGKWMATFDSNNPEIKQILVNMHAPHNQFHKAVGEIKEDVKRGQKDIAWQKFDKDLVPAANMVFAEYDKLRQKAATAQSLFSEATDIALGSYTQSIGKARVNLSDLLKRNESLVNQSMQTAGRDARNAIILASIITFSGFAFCIIFGTWLSVSLSRSLNKLILNLNDSSEQLTSASGQISSASQSLAEGATEQAASLEESSSALEEMASMARQNADNSKNANHMMSQTQEQMGSGASAVHNMSTAMNEISDSSEKISRIIKTIEEIAFQTNLLALNAAVEAARAGDAGKGFAVVADEVRNLAQRSAQAARDTAELIKSTVERVKNGNVIAQQLQESFSEVESTATDVAGLISEISNASNEQAQGVDQVNTAVAQMDKITQTNAANAEESASAAEELNAQAEQLRSLVSGLVVIVQGKNTDDNNSSSASAHSMSSHKSPAAISYKNKQNKRLLGPSDVLPLDD